MQEKNSTYRRQYILGSHFIDELTEWNKIRINKTYCLTSHPDLEVSEFNKGDVKIILLGFIIDPSNPFNTNEENLDQIISNSTDFDEVLSNLYSYSGRWILIYSSHSEFKLIHDPCGLRQVYYTNIEEKVWCSSQPNLMADILGYRASKHKELQSFVRSDFFKNEEGAWLGDGTIYDEIKHLLPNHYLDLLNNQINRYWINEETDTKRSLTEIVDTACDILIGSLIAINHRYSTMLALTAGWDSRVLLAASKNVKENINYFVSTMNILDSNHHDIKIPTRLAESLELNFDIINNLPELEKSFSTVLLKNVALARISLPKTLTIQYHYKNSQGKVVINGNGSEIIRSFYGNKHPKKITAKYLAQIAGYPLVPYVVSELDKWLQEVRNFSVESDNFDIVDLFYWEQRMGNWGAMYPAEQDIAIEEFCPFNNRKLLMIMASADLQYRAAPDYILYEKIIHNLWEEVLLEPINPLNIKDKFRKKVIDLLPRSAKSYIKALIKR